MTYKLVQTSPKEWAIIETKTKRQVCAGIENKKEAETLLKAVKDKKDSRLCLYWNV